MTFKAGDVGLESTRPPSRRVIEDESDRSDRAGASTGEGVPLSRSGTTLEDQALRWLHNEL